MCKILKQLILSQTLIYKPTFEPSQLKSKPKPKPKSKEALLHPPTALTGSPTYLPEPKLVLSEDGADIDVNFID